MDLTLENIILAMAGMTAVLTVVAVWSALLPRETMGDRGKTLIQRRQALLDEALGPRKRTQSIQALNFMRAVVSRLQMLSSHHMDEWTLSLARAGLRSNEAMIGYLFAKAALPVGAAATAAFFVFVAGMGDLSSTMKMLVVVGAGCIGALIPGIYIRNLANKRRKQLLKALPDSLDLMVICAEAGLSLESSLQRVSREIARTWPEMADELSLTAIEIGFMPDRHQALENLSNRCFLNGVRGLVNTLIQTEKYGTPLAQSLRVLAAELRNERMLRAEEKAARLPATLTVPMIIFILPPLFVVLIGPAVLSLIDSLSGF
ncbi:MAG: type II secretion system F family protein [Alphaproteobacteria bacterium]|jgi:tight adherence protein C|nr:type II secretion system F family protein [Alphaproteobacteria bacterium]